MAKMKIRTEKIIKVSDWDTLVKQTYGREYSLQQQDGCKSRGIVRIRVPDEPDDYELDIVPEIVNHEEMGVSFSAWLKRDPKAPLANDSDSFSLELWWARNFYPDIQMVANDLNSKGLLEAGDYTIDIE